MNSGFQRPAKNTAQQNWEVNMKISMVRRADALGRMVLPEEIRNALGIAEGTSVRG